MSKCVDLSVWTCVAQPGMGERCEVSELVLVLVVLLLRSGTLTAGARGGGLRVGSGSRTVGRRVL